MTDPYASGDSIGYGWAKIIVENRVAFDMPDGTRESPIAYLQTHGELPEHLAEHALEQCGAAAWLVELEDPEQAEALFWQGFKLGAGRYWNESQDLGMGRN